MRFRGFQRLVIAVVPAIAVCMLTQSAWANVYASSLKLNGTTITTCTAATVRYILNEDADGTPGVTIKVKRVSDNVAIRTVTFTNPATETRKGAHTFVWDKKDDGGVAAPDASYYYEITASDDGHAAWTQISDDANQYNMFYSLRGVAVNRNPNSPYYGRIYISNSAAGTPTGGQAVGDGIYMRNADSSDSDVGQGFTVRTGAQDWTLSTNSPFRLRVGQDDNLYIADYSDAHSGVYVGDPDIATVSDVLDSSDRGAGGLGSVHGSIMGCAFPVGTLAGGDLKIFAIDEDQTPVNGVWRWDINSGPVPYTSPGTNMAQNPLIALANVVCDIAVAPDGKIYAMQYRSAGTDAASLFVLSSDGSTILWDSLTATHAIDPLAADYLRLSYGGLAFTPDGLTLAICQYYSTTMIVPIDSGTGLPNLAGRTQVATGSVNNGRGIDFDAVGNVYIVTSGHARLRIWSPPTGANSAVTSSGQFALSGVGSGGPTFTQQPQNQSACLNAVANYSASATGAGTISYQWYRNGSPISGATTNSLAVTADGVNGVSGDTYYVSACDTNGVTVSNSATLTIYTGPVITQNPFNQAVYVGQSATFTIVGSSGAPSPLGYQWYKSPSTLLTGATAASLVLSNVTAADAGTYFARITDTCSRTADSGVGSLIVLPAQCGTPFADADGDTDADMDDFGIFQTCYTGDGGAGYDFYNCHCFDRGGFANAVDSTDLAAFIACVSGADVPANQACGGPPVLFTDDFDVDSTASWTVNKAVGAAYANDAGNIAEFFYDYSLLGIPSAPHSTGGSTRGLRLRADAVQSATTITLTGLTVSPTGQSFTGDYSLEFDAWLNFNGDAAGQGILLGAVGSTQITIAGFGTAGTSAQLPGSFGGTLDSLFVACSGDGQNAADYRVYDPAHAISYQDGTVVYAAGATTGGYGNRNALHPYYTQWFGGTVENNTAPAGQLASYPEQFGHTSPGAQGFRWRSVKVIKSGNAAVWFIDGRLIASVDLTLSGTLGGSNILLGQSDVNGNAAPLAQNELVFGLIDNVRVVR